MNAFIVEYRGYGESDGKPSINKGKSDALAAFDYLTVLPGMRDQPIVAYGFSLGSFIAPFVALHRKVAGLVLESTATDVKDWADNQIPWYAKLFVKLDIAKPLLEFSNVENLATYHGPLLLLAGGEDHITPTRFARRLLADSATPASEKSLYVAPKAKHGGIMNDPGAITALRRFIRYVISEKSPRNTASR